MSYKYSSGSVRRGDIYYEDDREGAATYIDFEQDTITLRPSGSQILHAQSDAVGIGTTSPSELLSINAQAMLARSCDLTLPMCCSAAHANAMNSNASDWFTATNAQAMLARCCDVKLPMHCSASLASAMNSNASD